jgi:hypothetical protein
MDLRAKILAAKDIKTERVDMPEWDLSVLVRGLKGIERDAFEESCYIGRGKDRQENFVNLRANLVARSIVDEDGVRVFSDDDIVALGEKSAAALDRIFAVAQRLSGLGQKDLETLVGNSGSGQNGATTSVSRSG